MNDFNIGDMLQYSQPIGAQRVICLVTKIEYTDKNTISFITVEWIGKNASYYNSYLPLSVFHNDKSGSWSKLS